MLVVAGKALDEYLGAAETIDLCVIDLSVGGVAHEINGGSVRTDMSFVALSRDFFGDRKPLKQTAMSTSRRRPLLEDEAASMPMSQGSMCALVGRRSVRQWHNGSDVAATKRTSVEFGQFAWESEEPRGVAMKGAGKQHARGRFRESVSSATNGPPAVAGGSASACINTESRAASRVWGPGPQKKHILHNAQTWSPGGQWTTL